jgi:pyruvate/2-oxoacid:ferredoxin oxidoreductase beta subunit
MKTILAKLKSLALKSVAVLSIVSLIGFINLLVPLYGYAAPKPDIDSEPIIQPFELTKPAESREEAYEKVAELTENPKELIKAQNKEEKAEEKVLKKEA